jgi:ribosome-binding protein aMBF1 (putative translation factor)
MDRAERGQQELKQRFADWLGDKLAERRDMTTSDLAAEIGVLDGDVEDWLAGRRTPVGQECRRLGQFFGVPDQEIVALCGDPSGQG